MQTQRVLAPKELTLESIEEDSSSADSFPGTGKDVGSPNSLSDWQDYVLGHSETTEEGLPSAMSSELLTSSPREDSYPTQMDPYFRQQILDDFQVSFFSLYLVDIDDN